MNRYDQIADWYDLYVQTDLDLAYFRRLAKPARRILDLMAGTGRVSIAMAEATRGTVTSIDRSLPMLRQLRAKTAGASSDIGAVCADACDLPVRPGFDTVVIPFNSIAEVTEPEGRQRLLADVRRVLAPDGVFVCTLHNPLVRIRTLDGVTRTHGPFDLTDGSRLTVEVTGTVNRATGPRPTRAAVSHQKFVRTSSSGSVLDRREQTVKFSLITRQELEEEAEGVGLTVEALHGDYDESAFDAARSPFMIWRFGRSG